MFTDSLGDMITRIRNGYMASLTEIYSPSSTLKKSLLSVLKEEGFIEDFYEDANLPLSKRLKIVLSYVDGKASLQNITRVSKPGRRIYSGIENLPKYYNGLGVIVLSTPKGVLADHEAHKQNVGGEILCKVF